MLPGSEELATIDALLARFVGVDEETCEMVRELLWDQVFLSPFEDTVAMLGGRFEVDGRALEACYKPMRSEDGSLRCVMVQVLDKTAVVAAEREQARAAERIERLSFAAASPQAFERFREECEQLFDSCLSGRCQDRFRTLHTLKGNARIFGFHQVARHLHEAEDALARGEEPDPRPAVALFREQTDEVRRVLGLDRLEGRIPVDRQALEAFIESLPAPHGARLRALTCTPPEALLAHHVEALHRLAEGRGVQLQVSVHGDPVPDTDVVGFEEALTHILTNAVTHAARPDQPLHLDVHLSDRAGPLRLRIQDDGAGVDRDALARKALQSGHWSPEQAAQASDQDKLELIFREGLSSRDQVDEAAGRGVGLAAVRRSVIALGGSIEVRSEPGEGTTFLVEGPPRQVRLRAA